MIASLLRAYGVGVAIAAVVFGLAAAALDLRARRAGKRGELPFLIFGWIVVSVLWPASIAYAVVHAENHEGK